MITVFLTIFSYVTYVFVITNVVYFGKCYTQRYFETEFFWNMFLMKPKVKSYILLARYFGVEYASWPRELR